MPITRKVLNKYRRHSDIFIESGTHTGATVKLAISAGFKEIYTIELAKHFYDKAVQTFKPYKQVHAIYGDSVEAIPVLLKRINRPCVFWLDGHWSAGDTALGPVAVPLYQELDEIAKHPIKSHTILIDDVRLMGKEWKEILLEEIKKRLKGINKSYRLRFEDGYLPGEGKVLKNDILVAMI